MFVGGEVLLDVSFDVARARLVSLLRSGTLLAVSQGAYSDGAAGLTRAGPQGPVPVISRLVKVKAREPAAHGTTVLVALRWEVIGPDGGLFPALDADITLAPGGEGASVLRLGGAYRPPLDGPRTGPDRAIVHGAATATVQGFLDRVGAAIVHPAPAAGPAWGTGTDWWPPDAEVS